MLAKSIPLGIYEKALPAGECWLERLQLAKALGFDFVEMSLDETNIYKMCIRDSCWNAHLSVFRKFIF